MFIQPHNEAGYTSAVVTDDPDPADLLQSGGVHIHPHMRRSYLPIVSSSRSNSAIILLTCCTACGVATRRNSERYFEILISFTAIRPCNG